LAVTESAGVKNKKTFQIEVIFNPLRFYRAEFPKSKQKKPPSYRHILRFLTDYSLKSTPGAFVKRYKKLIGELEKPIILAPADKRILEKFVFPLQHAFHSYLLGDYLGCISLCGMVAEMCSILIFGITDKKIPGRKWDENVENGLFGRTFEKLNQDRRITILRTLGFINEQTYSDFDEIRLIRRKYLHYLSVEYDELENDAKTNFVSAAKILNSIMQPRIDSNRITFNSNFVKYLIREGIMRKVEQEETAKE
jgi:hypothetical protein